MTDIAPRPTLPARDAITAVLMQDHRPILDTALSGCAHYKGENAEVFREVVREDYRQALIFLNNYRHNAPTYSAYRRDIERLLLWAWWIMGESALNAESTFFQAHTDFLAAPPKHWVTQGNRRRQLKTGEPNPAWRPFAKRNPSEDGSVPDFKPAPGKALGLTYAARTAALASLSAFYGHLVKNDLMKLNPVAGFAQKRNFIGAKGGHQRRLLSNTQWEACCLVADRLAEADPKRHERSRFILHLVCGLYLRISEVVPSQDSQPVMSHFFQDSQGYWWFEVPNGKGRKNRKITVPEEVLEALKRYRASLTLGRDGQEGAVDLPLLPTAEDKTPLLRKSGGQGALVSARQVRRILKDIFERAAAFLQARGADQEAANLESATVHWLRHTGISRDVQVRPLLHVRDDAGHESIHTTSIYLDADDRERALSRAQAKKSGEEFDRQGEQHQQQDEREPEH